MADPFEFKPAPLEFGPNLSAMQKKLMTALGNLLDKEAVSHCVFMCVDPDSDELVYFFRGNLTMRLGLMARLNAEAQTELQELDKEEGDVLP